MFYVSKSMNCVFVYNLDVPKNILNSLNRGFKYTGSRQSDISEEYHFALTQLIYHYEDLCLKLIGYF